MTAEMRFVDAHCHLDLYSDMKAVADRSYAARVRVLSMTTTPRAWERNLDLARDWQHVDIGLGLHPQLVQPDGDEFDLWLQLLPKAPFVGEVGLDASGKYYRSFSRQQEVFRGVLQACAEVGNRVLSVHAVRCVPRVLALVEEHLPADRGAVILHWFTGTPSDAAHAVSLGCYFSINRAMVASPVHVETIRKLPLGRILTETDGPFTTHQGSPAEPAQIGETVKWLANIRGEDVGHVESSILRTFAELQGYTALS